MFGKEYVTLSGFEEARLQLTKQLDDLRSTISMMEHRILTMEKELTALKAENVVPQDVEASTEVSENSAMVMAGHANSHPSASLQTFFLPAPTADGTFPNCSLTEQTGTSIYQMSTFDGEHGRFIMLSTPDAIATAMISVSQFVKPVCRIEGNTRVLPRSIETLEEGVVKKENNGWKLVRKAIVKFEA